MDLTVLLSVTVTTTVKGLPTLLVGVPLIMPVAEPMVKPVGRPVAENVYGAPAPPVAVTVVEGYTTFGTPVGRVAGAVITSAGLMVTL